jgi:hypothetical protein
MSTSAAIQRPVTSAESAPATFGAAKRYSWPAKRWMRRSIETLGRSLIAFSMRTSK